MITIDSSYPPYVYYLGQTFTIEWYRDTRGKMKALDYYMRLSGEEQERLDDLVKLLANNPIGVRLSTKLYNLENAEHKIYAFKPKDHRFFNFMVMGRRIIIVDAYRKHAQQMTKKDLNQLKAVIQARTDYMERVKEGSYYDWNA